MRRKIILCCLFFLFTPILIFLSVYLFLFYEPESITDFSTANFYSSKMYAAVPQNKGVIASSLKTESATPIIIENYLKRYNSPLLPYKDKILQSGVRYQVKPELIVAIAQQESNLGKKSLENCFNAWGWGIHAKGTKCYSNWEEAIESVTKGIANDYCAKNYCDDPCLMMKKYTPRSNGSWCFGVKQFLKEMESGEF